MLIDTQYQNLSPWFDSLRWQWNKCKIYLFWSKLGWWNEIVTLDIYFTYNNACSYLWTCSWYLVFPTVYFAWFFCSFGKPKRVFLGLVEKTLDQGVVFHLHSVILRCITSYNIYIYFPFLDKWLQWELVGDNWTIDLFHDSYWKFSV